MFVVRLRIGAGRVDDAVPVVRRRIQRIELQRNISGIDDIVIRPGRDEHREARADCRGNAVENRLARALLHAKELVEPVNLGPDRRPPLAHLLM